MRGKSLFRVLLTGLMLMALVLAGCDDGSNGAPGATGPAGADGADAPVAPLVPTFSVKDTAGFAVEGATVYAIPAADVAEISAVSVTLTDGNYDAASLAADEPLEDLLNDNFTPTSGGVANYVSGMTDANGKVELTSLPVGATDMYFIYVAPAATDTGHLPGGNMTRYAVSGASLDMALTAIEVSTIPSERATYVGSSACLACHTGKMDQTKTAHKHGIMNIGSPSGLQDLTKFDDGTLDGVDDGIYDYMAGVRMFTDGTVATGGTTIWFSDFDSTRGFDKYKTQMTDPSAPGVTVYATVRLYKDTTSLKYMMQITNILDPADGNSPLNVETDMTYGGGVYKQRYLSASVSGKSLNILPVQYQAAGKDTSADRTRKQYRDYHMDRWYDAANSLLIVEPSASKSFDTSCAACHYTGYQVATDPVTGEFTASAVADVNGTLNPLTGEKQEMNVGCETCHGPGSDHILAGGHGAAIVTPQNLPASREAQICGQCHSRAQGVNVFSGSNDQTIDAAGQMMRPGTSRADYLANNTTRDDASQAKGNIWADNIHSKSHHQQYTDFLKSGMYRNDSELMTCTSCHSVHAPGAGAGLIDNDFTDRHQLTGASDNSLCLSCHTTVVSADHQVAKTGSTLHSTEPAQCIECHNVKTAKSGAGDALIPTNGGDITSHVFDVPFTATDSMPLAHDNSCGVCHTP